MKNFKSSLVALTIIFGCSVFAAPAPVSKEVRKVPPVSYEIETMLRDSNLIIEGEFMVTVIFQVTVEKRIDIRSIKSPDEEVNTFLEKRLRNRKLHGDAWYTGKIYELPVRVKANK